MVRGEGYVNYPNNIPRTNLRVFFLASASLSPCHKTLEENSLFLPEPGTAEPAPSRKALLFDETVENWVRFGDRNNLLVRALSLALDAYPSGMTILGLLQAGWQLDTLQIQLLSEKLPKQNQTKLTP